MSALIQKAIEIARREFAQLRDVEDERIYFSMYVKRDARGYDTSARRSRISPHNWETFFKMTVCGANNAITVLHVELYKPKGRSWAERLGFTKGGKAEAEKREDDGSKAAADLPVYSKTEP